MAEHATAASLTSATFDRLLDLRQVDAAFQPIVEIDSGEVVGYEALARGPEGSAFASPEALFGDAYRLGRVGELDWACRAVAFRAAMAADLPASIPLFINVEPRSLGTPCPPDLATGAAAAAQRLRIVMEVTERSLATDPATLLAAVAQARRESTGIALDDLGAEPSSLVVMPLVRPDVIKLDLRVIQDQRSPGISRIVNAVLAEAEQTGATILAEGVESGRHLAVARSMGATLAQGWHFGRPGPLPRRLPEPHNPIQFLPFFAEAALAPFDAVARQRRVSRATKELLIPISMHLEYKVLDSSDPSVLLACFQSAHYFEAATRYRFARLAEQATLTAALGLDMPSEPAPGVRGGQLAPGDPLAGEWVVIVIGPHFAAALLARDCGDRGPELARRFDFVITHDRRLVIDAARPLVQRLLPTPGPRPAG